MGLKPVHAQNSISILSGLERTERKIKIAIEIYDGLSL